MHPNYKKDGALCILAKKVRTAYSDVTANHFNLSIGILNHVSYSHLALSDKGRGIHLYQNSRRVLSDKVGDIQLS